MTNRGITLFVSLMLISAAAIAQDQQAIRDQLFGDTDAIKTQADAANAVMLAPDSYSEGMDLYLSAGETLQRGRDLDRVREDLAEASLFFQQAIERAELAHLTFAGALEARAAAERAEAAIYAERNWERAEDELIEAAERLEGGDLNRAQDTASDAEERYREVEAEAIQEKAEAEAEANQN